MRMTKHRNIAGIAAVASGILVFSALSACAQEEALQAVAAAGNSVVRSENAGPESAESPQNGILLLQEPATDVPQIMLKNNAQYKYDPDTDRYMGHVSWQEIRLTEESAAAFPALQQSLEAWDADFAANAAQMEESLFDPETLEFLPEDMELSYEDSIRLLRTDTHVLSFLDEHTEYTGGAHGYYSLRGYSYDVQSGEAISLSDVIPDQDRLRSVLTERLQEEYPVDSYFSMENIADKLAAYGYGKDLTQYIWALGREGVTFIFNPYEIASYAEGLIQTEVRFSDYPDLFEEKWVQPEDGFTQLGMDQPVRVALGNDNETSLVTIGTEYEEVDWDTYEADYRQIKGYEVQIGDLSLSHEAVGCYRIRPSLVYVGAERYLYLDLTFDNDWRRLDIVRITDKVPTFVSELWNNGPGWSYDASDESYNERQFTDPHAFCMGTRINLLSTYTGIRYYQAGPDGVPVPYQPEYYRNTDSAMPLVTTRELNSKLVDTNTGNVTEEPCLIGKGEELTIWRTDGSSYVDLLRENGTAVRLEVENGENWPHIVDGYDENECFEILYYAG